MIETLTHVLFYSGVYSNWYIVPIKIDNLIFNCVEQYIMYNKALLFGDTNSAKLIMATASPAQQKKLGRKVKNFNVSKWDTIKKDVAKRAIFAKFSQHAYLHALIIKTSPRIFVEASPVDFIWGIGLSEQEALKFHPNSWPGRNLLGQVLTEVRDELALLQKSKEAHK